MASKQGPLASISKALSGIFRSGEPSTSSHAARAQRGAGTTAAVTQDRFSVPRPLTLAEHWAAMKASGFAATQVVDYLQPIADLEGISVSYVYTDEAGQERIYNHRNDDITFDNPLSRAIKDKKLTKPVAMKLALTEEGRTWIESNFITLE